MVNFEIREIIDRSSSLAVYKRGLEYYKSKRVSDLYIDDESDYITSEVQGENETYDVSVYFDEHHIVDASCNCKAYSNWEGFCKHIVATLLSAKMDNNAYNYNSKSFPIKEIIDYYIDNDIQSESEKVMVEASYFLTVDTYNRQTTLSVKFGETTKYILKKPDEFIGSLNKNKEYEFGKKFIFDPIKHEFSQRDGQIFQIISNIVEDEKYFNNGNYGLNKYALIKGKEITFTNNNLRKFMDLMNGCQLELKINDNVQNVKIRCSNIRVAFEINEKNTKFELKLDNLDKVKVITDDFRILYLEGVIYYISEEQANDLYPLFLTLEKDSLSVTIEKSSLDMFMSYLYPKLKKTCEVKISKNVEDRIYLKKCEAKLYLDVDGEGIKANLKYKYGDYIYDSFKGLESKKMDNIIVLRDMKFETSIMQILENSAMKVSKSGYHIEDEEDVYQFFKLGIKKLEAMVAIYYSEGFSKVDIKDKSSIMISSTFNESLNFLTFKFSVDDIDTTEIPFILNAIKEKKKYYRLQNGSFLTLDSEVLFNFSSIMDDLLIESTQFVDGALQLPANRAFYLNDALEDLSLEHFKRNLPFKELILRIRNPEDEVYDIPEAVKDILRPYQVTGYNWLRTLSQYNFGGILADDMGLGKTLQVLSYIKSELLEDPSRKSLIVAPTSLIYNWLNEVNKFLPSLKVLVVDGPKKMRADKLSNLKAYNVVISSYALVRNDIDMYMDLNIDLMIIDEAQHIKNPHSKTSRAVKRVNAKKRFALTGTPIENSLLELWSIFDFVMPGYMQSLSRFQDTYEKPLKDGDQGCLVVLRKMISPFILRRLKRDVLKELPDKIENKIVVELNDEQKKVYVGYLDKVKGELAEAYKAEGFNKSRIKILAALTRLRQICCHPGLFIENYKGSSSKLDLLEELLEELIEGQHRVLIFSQFTSMLALIKNLLTRKKIAYFSLDGSTKALKRNEMVDEFNEGKNDVFLISLKAGGTGLNLTGADTVIHFDPWWNPAVEAQATDRAYRIGQEKKVHVMKLITKGTIEEKIFELQDKKRELIDSVVKPGETMITKMSEDDIRDLFE